jgi:hypothetical protein
MTVTRASVAEEEYFRRQEAERRSDEAWDSLQKTTKANREEHERREASRPQRPTQAAPGLVARLFARLRGSAAPKAKSSP